MLKCPFADPNVCYGVLYILVTYLKHFSILARNWFPITFNKQFWPISQNVDLV